MVTSYTAYTLSYTAFTHDQQLAKADNTKTGQLWPMAEPDRLVVQVSNETPFDYR